MSETAIAAALLSIERVAYVWIARWPVQARSRLARLGPDPVAVVRRLFYAFKALQIGVFLWWCLRDGTAGLPVGGSPAAVVAGVALVLAGQALSTFVFARLGTAGTFYGAQFGLDLPIVRTFPFTWFRHPQYVGAVASIWGLFLIVRFPHPDWFVLPLIETVYYALGARLER